jgi:hypothetical protein
MGRTGPHVCVSNELEADRGGVDRGRKKVGEISAAQELVIRNHASGVRRYPLPLRERVASPRERASRVRDPCLACAIPLTRTLASLASTLSRKVLGVTFPRDGS